MNKMCYHPWVGLDVSPQGEFKPCCKYTRTVATSLTEYQNSTELAELKQQFLNGQQPEACSRCWRDEEAGLPSKRELDNQFVFDNQAPSLDGIKAISIPFGNICNLACRICSSYSSSKWGQESKKLKDKLQDIKIFDHTQFYKDADFMSEIKQITKDVIRVDIPGGEPMFADQEIHADFLQHLADNNGSNISLHYTTNGTKYPNQQIVDLWQRFKHVDIQISLDGIRRRFEYNRWPAKWNNVLANVGRFLAEQSNHTNMQISISHTVSIFTVWHLPEFLEWTKEMGIPKPYLGLLSRPSHYSITTLPKEAKQAIEERLSKYPELEPIIKAMWAEDNSKELDIFIKYVKIVDTQRQESFVTTFPELYKLLGERCQTLYQLY